MTNPSGSTQSQNPIPAAALQEIGRAVLHNVDRTTALYRESPPEAVLQPILRLAFHGPLERGELLIHCREHIVLPTDPPKDVELDAVLHVPATGATGAIEIDSWAYHARTMPKHHDGIERDRLIRRFYPLVRYSAREVMRNPWCVVLDLAEQLTRWEGFGGIVLDPAMHDLCAACASIPPESEQEAPAPVVPGEERRPIPMLQHAREAVARLPPPHPSPDPAIQQIRAAYPRHYALWEPTEVELLRQLFLSWTDAEEIAQLLGRTPPAIWRQVGRLGLIEE